MRKEAIFVYFKVVLLSLNLPEFMEFFFFRRCPFLGQKRRTKFLRLCLFSGAIKIVGRVLYASGG
jgi:hypothetical protein